MYRALASAAVGLLVLVGSCSDNSVAPLRPFGSAANIDISVATVALDIIYDGQSIGPSMGAFGGIQGDKCFTVTVDDQPQMMNACGSMEVRDLQPGPHSIGLKQFVPGAGPPPAMGTLEDVQPPVAVDLVGGTSTPVSFDISAIRGTVSGTFLINGQPPAGHQYSACIEGFSCTPLVASEFTLLVRPGAGKIYFQSMMAFSRVAEVQYTAVASENVDLGTIDVEFATLAVDIVYDGQSIGQSMGGFGGIQGDRCFYLTIDGQRQMMNSCGSHEVRDLVAGTRLVGLQDFVPSGGPPPAMGTYVDVTAPVPVDLIGNQTTPVSFDISAVRGKVIGSIKINGQAPPPHQYSICIDGSSCSPMVSGTFAMLVRPGNGKLYLQSMMGGSRIVEIPFTAVAGQNVDVGEVSVDFATVALDIQYNGQTIGPSMGGFGGPQGERCFTVTVDGQPQMMNACGSMEVRDLSPGPHMIGLKHLVPGAGPPPAMGTLVDVQAPIAVNLVGGQTTPVSFDISAIRGMISGSISINGQVPPDHQYQVCMENSSCGVLIGGNFVMFARIGTGKAFLRSMMQGTTLAQFTYIVAPGMTTLITGVSTGAPGATPPGSNVTIQPVNQTDGSSNATVGLTFDNVSAPGTTTVLQSSNGAPAPAGFQFGDPPVYFNISTSATFDGAVEVCINYTGTTFAEGAPIELLHGDAEGNWTVVTTSHDVDNRIICGSVASFSPFIVAERTAPVPTVPPSVTPTVEGTEGSAGWYTSSVTVKWTVDGNGSAITSSVGCADGSITSDTPGTTLTCTAVSAAGTTERSVTIKRDAHGPVIAFSGNAGTYAVDQSVSIACSATDATSGIATASCPTISGDAYTFAIGANSFAATASDKAGNESSTGTSFTVAVTSDGLCALTTRWSSKEGLAKSLCAKLAAAAASRARGNAGAAQGQINAYANEVRAQSGKGISTESAQILVDLAGQL